MTQGLEIALAGGGAGPVVLGRGRLASRNQGSETKGFFFSSFLLASFFFSSLFRTLSRSLWRSPDENSTNQLRINRDSDNTTSNSPFTATGATRGPTQHSSTEQRAPRVCVCATILSDSCDIFLQIYLPMTDRVLSECPACLWNLSTSSVCFQACLQEKLICLL